MQQSDWDVFLEHICWFLEPGAQVNIERHHLLASEVFLPSNAFQERFPQMTALLSGARVSEIIVDGTSYILYTWAVSPDSRCGWLCERPELVDDRLFHHDHRLLLTAFGGVRECFNEPRKTWLMNLNWSVCASKAGLLGPQEINRMREGIEETQKISTCPIMNELGRYIRFALEANGNFTAYRQTDSAVVMFASDHSFQHIVPLEGCPDFTFYKIRGVPFFVEWIEEIARQWRVHVGR